MVIFFSCTTIAAGLTISPPKAPEPYIHRAFPTVTDIGKKSGDPPIWTLREDKTIVGYAFETNDIAPIPAYSGEPINLLVAMDTGGTLVVVQVLEHHEPILLVGIPEQKLFDFTYQYSGIGVQDRVKIGRAKDGAKQLDGLSGATVTVMVVNLAVMRAAKTVATSLGIVKTDNSAASAAQIKSQRYHPADWATLVGDGSIRHLTLSHGDVERQFGPDASSGQLTDLPEDMFIDLYYTELDIPSVGKNLLGESEYQWLMQTLQPGEHALGIMANGFSFKGSGYVRGGIFDRILVHQGDGEFSFRDADHYRINDLYATGAPQFSEMSIFIVRQHHHFQPASAWQLELLIRRQTGPVDSVFTSFLAPYQPPEKYFTHASTISKKTLNPDTQPALWQQVWTDQSNAITLLIVSMLLLFAVIFLQDWLVRYPRLLHGFRRLFLVYTVLFIGWYSLGQLSIVNVFTFVQSLMGNFHWEVFLLDPIIFVLWVFVAASVLLWGRGIYCGWLCPFGALQELLSQLAVKLKIPQIVVPFAAHERLWAVKYLILLALFGLSLESLSSAEQYAEVEPFKTTFLLRFDRRWPFVIYALGLLFVSLFSRKVYCRYLCPLGAALAIPSGIRLFNWLKRRKECGQPCQICANECEIGAIEPHGEINLRECHHCLDCQVTYQDKNKCPPLVKKYNKPVRQAPDEQRLQFV